MADMDAEVGMYLAAVKLATAAHAGQMYGDVPYTIHLAHVEHTLVRFDFTEPHLLAAAWLHDSVEDKTGVTLDEINRKLGLVMVQLVECLTDGEGANRAERKAQSYYRMACRPESIPVKLADRIANVEACVLSGDGRLAMYRKGHAEFRKKLHHASLTVGATHMRTRAMWSYLDDLIAGSD
jgi:(p)ppGpp synthase/HD superfamily hydrolase